MQESCSISAEDPRVLVAQWVLQWEHEFDQQSGDQTIELAMEPWMDGYVLYCKIFISC